MTDIRTEIDSMGPMQVPAHALWGPQTARACANFPISGWTMPRRLIAALAAVKLAAAQANTAAGRLNAKVGQAIAHAAREVMDGQFDGHFPLDIFQTGSGTSTNMNVNEVIANRAAQLLGGAAGRKDLVHPNDHVNMGQSSNDVIPTAIHVATYAAIVEDLRPAVRHLIDTLHRKVREFDTIVKIGRTHLMDAVPVRLGQEFSGYAAIVEQADASLSQAAERLAELPIGGTAVGTGLNAPEGFAAEVCSKLRSLVHGPWLEACNHFAAQSHLGTALSVSGGLKTLALAMGKVASDVRLLGSGPRCGLGELHLPPVQPGSSIMPGKVNPVICESLIQVACQVVGCDAAITAGATGGVGSILELNVAMPLIAWNLLTATRLLAAGARNFADACIAGLTADEQRCLDLVELSLAMVTALAPVIGYDKAAEIAKAAYATGRTVREVALDKKVLPADELDRLLEPRRQTGR